MKKRRELDALIGNRSRREIAGSDSRRVELDTLSSLSSPDGDTFLAPSGTYVGVQSKRLSRNSGSSCGCTIRRMIRICLPACFLSLVAACITACIGIVWMQVQLKTDVEKLTSRIGKLEVLQQEQPSTIKQMKVSISSIEKELQVLKDGENGVKDLAENLGVLTQKFDRQVINPDKKIQDLKNGADEMKQILDEVKSSVASMKSTMEAINSAQEMVTASYNKLNQDVKDIQKDILQTSDENNVKQLTNLVSTSKQNVETIIVQMNSTVEKMSDRLSTLEHRVVEIDKMNTREEILKKINPELKEMKGEIAALKQVAIPSPNNNPTASPKQEIPNPSTESSPEAQKKSSQETADNAGKSTTPNLNEPAENAPENQQSGEAKHAPDNQQSGEAKHEKKRRSLQTVTRNKLQGNMEKIKSHSDTSTIRKEPSKPVSPHYKNDRNLLQQKSALNGISMRELLSEISRRFTEIDKNKDLKLSLDEVESVFGIGLFKTLRSYDEDNDDALSPNELLHVMSHLQTPDRLKPSIK